MSDPSPLLLVTNQLHSVTPESKPNQKMVNLSNQQKEKSPQPLELDAPLVPRVYTRLRTKQRTQNPHDQSVQDPQEKSEFKR
jgi:hypothetical protein